MDPTWVSYHDLASNCYGHESEVRSPSPSTLSPLPPHQRPCSRAQSCLASLQALNPYVQVEILNHDISISSTSSSTSSSNSTALSALEITKEFLSQFQVVVCIDQSYAHVSVISAYCHELSIAFLLGDCKGLCGMIFTDFGERFHVSDVNGEPASVSMIAMVTADAVSRGESKGESKGESSNSQTLLITVLEDTPHRLDTGDVVVITEVQGMPSINDKEYRVRVKDLFSFEIDYQHNGRGIESDIGRYTMGGYVTQVKQPTTIEFKPWHQSIEEPEYSVDWMKMDKAPLLHAAWRALDQFKQENSRLPRPGNVADGAAFYDTVVTRNRDAASAMSKFHLPEEDIASPTGKEFFVRFAQTAAGLISPICSVVGGVLGQEILKACSGKFMPVKQWYYFDALEALPETQPSEEEVAPMGSRYDAQIAIFGRSFQAKLAELNCFLVGAGAIGCEILKLWALMGVATTPSVNPSDPSARGLVHVTDMDQIERSNLSRQFLFRNTDIGKMKSTTAARAASAMNPSFNIVAYESKVATDTEAFFNDNFFESLDIVCAALDNVEARLYLDQRCMFYHKPMLESGTLGTKGNTTVVVPKLTAHYGATRDPPEKSIPMCTVKSFPNQIEHTLQWAREWFEETFKQTPSDVNS